MAKSGDYYWVFANVAADYDRNGKPIGYFRYGANPAMPESKPSRCESNSGRALGG